jgi:hypothetical protein
MMGNDGKLHKDSTQRVLNAEALSLARTGITVALLKVHSERKTSGL